MMQNVGQTQTFYNMDEIHLIQITHELDVLDNSDDPIRFNAVKKSGSVFLLVLF